MKPFKVKFGDIATEFTKKIEKLENNLTLRFYFEDKDSILVFLVKNGFIIYSEIKNSQIELNNFKMEYLGNSIELQENPIDKKR